MPRKPHPCSKCGGPAWGINCRKCGWAKPAECRQCGACGTDLTAPQSKRGALFCSILCANRAAGVARSGEQHGKSSRPCEWCGQQFKPTHSQPTRPQRFCSKSCRGEWQQSQHPKSSHVYPRQCDGCGGWFVARNSRTRCCSKDCGYEVWYAKSYQKQPVPESARCLRCGETFVPAVAWNRYCSKLCSSADNRDRRSARKRDAYVADVYRAEIYKRDGYRCQICGKRLAMKQKAPHPKSPTIDHVIPLSLGGTHEPANCQSAHFWCNSAKGNRGGGEQLMLVG